RRHLPLSGVLSRQRRHTTALADRKTIEIVCKCNRARKALTDFRLGLLFLAEGPQHSVRQHESLDLRLLCDLSDYGRRHMEPPLNPGSSFWNSVVSNK